LIAGCNVRCPSQFFLLSQWFT